MVNENADFTPAWRNSGLPTKPSLLKIEKNVAEQGRVINPVSLATKLQSFNAREVLEPPRTLEYNDTSIEPHYLAKTKCLELRKMQRTGNCDYTCPLIKSKAMKWHTMKAEEVQKKIRACKMRRKSISLKMSSAQYDLEKKYV